jgi:serine/threonine protein phosphatase PrpC
MTKSSPALEFASLTDAGMVRPNNEDNHATDVVAGFAILADGMGGYNAGEVASALAVAQLSARLRAPDGAVAPADRLRRLVEQANAAIHYMGRTREHCAGMGATLVVALFRPGAVIVAHVGDSRLYRLRGARFEAMTRDHSVLQEELDGGLITTEQARLSHNKNLVTRALGVDASVEVAVAVHASQPGDVYLLCSDGLNDMVADDAIEQVLRDYPGDLAAGAAQLVGLANRNGGRDNVTVILARVLAEPAKRGPVEPGWLARLSDWIKPAG